MSIFVKSVEYIEVVVGATSLVTSVSLTKGQNYDNCVPFYSLHTSSDYFDSNLIDVYFSGFVYAGVINFERGTQRNNTVTVKCYVVEFYPTRVRVQQGTFDVSSASTDSITLPDILSDVNKAAINLSWKSTSTSQTHSPNLVRGRVLSTTSVDFYRHGTNGDCTGHWYLFEDLASNFNVTHKEQNFAGSTIETAIDGERCIDPLRTFLLGSFASANVSGYPSRGSMRSYLYSDGTIYSNKTDATYYTIYWSMQIIEFLDLSKVYVPFYVNNSSFYTTTSTHVLGNDTEGSAFTCDTSYSMVASTMPQGLQQSNTSTAAATNETFISTELTNGNTITLEKVNAGYWIWHGSYHAIDWRGIDVSVGTNPSPIPEGKGQGESFVKSVENFRFTLAPKNGSKVLTKGQVWENCVLFTSTRGTGSDYLKDNMVNVYLLSPGIIYFKSWSATNQIIDVSVVEFWPDQVKVQHGNKFNQHTTTTTTNIETVSDVNKCFILSKSFMPGADQSSYRAFTRVDFEDPSTLRFYINNAGFTIDNSFFIVEDLQDNFETRHFLADFTSANYTVYNDEFNWDQETTFVLTSYASAGTSTYPSRNFIRSYYINEYNPFFVEKIDATYHTIYFYTTLVRFIDKGKHTMHSNPTFNATSVIGEYPIEYSEHSNALTCLNTIQQSSIRCNTSAAAGNSDSFGTIRITDYTTRSYEQTKAAHGYTSYGSFTVIDWVGSNYQQDNALVRNTPTRAIVNSMQIEVDNNDLDYWEICTTKGQDIKQCVPFINASAVASDNAPIRFYQAAYRYENPDRFVLRMGKPPTSSARKITCTLIEFGEDIKVQYGEGYSNATDTKSFTIEEVNLARAFLVFYTYSDHTEKFLRSHAFCGHFTSTTSVEFVRDYGASRMYVSWYVIECPDDDSYWKVQHIYDINKGGGSTITIPIPEHIDHSRTLLLSSWTTNAPDDYPSRSIYRMYSNIQNQVLFNKLDVSYRNMNNVNIEVVEFSKELSMKGFKSHGEFVSLIGGTTSTDVDLKNDSFDIARSMVISGNQGGEGRSDTSAEQGFDEGYHHYLFKDANTVTATKAGGAGYTTYSYFYAYQWPEYNKYYMEGTIEEETDEGHILIDREVLAYRSSTGKLVDKTTSSGGYFFVETPYPDEHYIICKDDNAGLNYNHLIYGRMQPAVILGSFSYNEGLVTTSGMDVGVPLGRL